MSTGGNKTRKLEFLFAEAELQKADIVMTQGATQSNHTRQTAAFAAKLGMQCHILLEDRTGSNNANYNSNGNVLLDHLHGATTEKRRGKGLNMNAEMEAVADTLRAKGKNVYTNLGFRGFRSKRGVQKEIRTKKTRYLAPNQKLVKSRD